MNRLMLFFCLVFSPLWGREADPAAILTPLLDPQKLDALKGERAANSRLRQMMYWLETARLDGKDPEVVIRAAQRKGGYAGTHALMPTLSHCFAIGLFWNGWVVSMRQAWPLSAKAMHLESLGGRMLVTWRRLITSFPGPWHLSWMSDSTTSNSCLPD